MYDLGDTYIVRSNGSRGRRWRGGGPRDPEPLPPSKKNYQNVVYFTKDNLQDGLPYPSF